MEFDRIIDSFIARFIGTKHERDVKRISPLIVEINALEPQT
jgi:preprotein translocase subunit SecA